MKDVNLPDGNLLSLGEATDVVARYFRENAVAVALYDDTNVGPHDELLPVDLLALNALNAFVGVAPMTPMAEMWSARDRIPNAVRPISCAPFEELSSSMLAAERVRVVAALEIIEDVRGFRSGGTRTAKLLHRLRPNLVPIWDARVGDWYGGSTEDWESYVSRVYDDLLSNRAALLEIRSLTAARLSIVRVWDILLWKLKDG